MFKRTKVHSAVLAAVSAGLLGVGPGAQAQAQTPDGQRIEITGSRIRSIAADSASPLQVVTGEEIARSGALNVQEFLTRHPAVGGLPTFSRTNSYSDSENSGVTTIDLRNLGEERTLVLVDGKRFVAGVPGSSAVDLNAIPVDFIDRIELLTGGASSAYGSDAVAGVVNIILKRDFQGLVVDVQAGQSARRDDRERKFSLTWGANAEGGKGNVMLHFGYSRQGAVHSRDRNGLGIDNVTDSALTGVVGDVFSFTTPFYSSYEPAGRFFVDPGNPAEPSRTIDASGNIVEWSTNGPDGDGVGAHGFNRQQYRNIAVPTERYMLAGKGEFEVAADHRAYLEATYVKTKTRATIEPFPLEAPNIYPATGEVPAEFVVNGALVRNPVVPLGIYSLLTKRNADGALVYGFTRRLNEAGNRGSNAQTDTFRVASGVKGSFLRSWDYDVYGIHGSNKRADVSGGQVNVQSFRHALEAIPDVDDVDGDGNVAEAICRDAQARAQGCVPIDIFGAGAVSADALRYVQVPSYLNTLTTQKIVGATVSGEAFAMPAGPLGVAAGVEYRREYSRSEFDALQQAGLNTGNAIPKTEGGFSVKEAYVEARIPLLKNAPFARSLSVNGAVRASDYSTVGSTTSWNAGAEWSPSRSVKLRVTRALSTRAPNIDELYAPPTQTFVAVNDPCVGVTATSADARSVACRSAPGVAANIAQNGAFALNQSDIQGVSGFDRGNPRLDEEKGRSTTIGIVLTPDLPGLRNFTFTADYFKIDVSQAIVATPRQFILGQCYGGDASFCPFVRRRAASGGANSAGSLEFVDSAVTNSGGLSTEGIDFTVGWAERVGPGNLSARASYTYSRKGYLVPLPGSNPDPFVGEVGSPKHKGTLALGYHVGPFGISSVFTALGKQSLDDQWLATLCEVELDAAGECPNGQFARPNSVGIKSKIYTDLQFTYTQGRVQYYLGIDNAFNTRNQRCDTNALIGGENGGCALGTGTFAGDDPIGRRFYVGLKAGF